ncbi:MAG: aldehyde ferredoxin oxidoreductase family protein [Zestosphaera sp.]
MAGKTAFIDLSKKKVKLEDSRNYVRLIGGRGTGAYLLFHFLEPKIKPFDPANIVVISPGRLVGTACPEANRTNVSSKSPITEGIGYSNVGGFFGYRLKCAGIDNLVIYGESEKPAYLLITKDTIEIRDAPYLWGLTTTETLRYLRKELGSDISVMTIGPAGENLVFASAIIVDEGNAAGGCGIASVLGSKKLKAIIAYGDEEIQVAHPEVFSKLREEIIGRIEKSSFAKTHKNLGSFGRVLPRFQKLSMLPVRNYEDDVWDEDKLNKLLDALKYRVDMKGCPLCHMPCMNVLEIHEGKHTGTRCVGLQANAGYGFGPRFDIDDPSVIIKANALCNELGLDIDNAATIISWIFELYNKGLISREEVDGLELTWGCGDALLEMLRKLAYREGIGDILAMGFKQATLLIDRGSGYYAMQVKNQGIIDSVRTAVAWGFGHFTSIRGARHLDGSPTTEARDYTPDQSLKLFGVATASLQTVYEGKARLVFWFENFKAVTDALGICYFATYWGNALELLGPDDYAKLYYAVTGEEIASSELLLIGRKIREYEKAFNTIHANFTRTDDMPPPRVFVEEVKSGKLKGLKIDRKKYDEMLSEYYNLHGWDENTGLQKRETLLELGLQDIVSKLEKYGKLK